MSSFKKLSSMLDSFSGKSSSDSKSSPTLAPKASHFKETESSSSSITKLPPSAAPEPTAEFTDFFINLSDLTIGPRIGVGQFGSVHAGLYFGDVVAIKVQTRKTKSLESYLVRELSVLKSMRHENLLEYIGACDEECDTGNTLYIVTEFAQNGDLAHLIKSDKKLGVKFLTKIALGCADAIAYLHDKNIIHRDIKPDNVLLDVNWNPKVADLGMAREFLPPKPSHGDSRSGSTRDLLGVDPRRAHRGLTICGTDMYMAPELMFDEPYGFAADTFSFGVVLFEVMARKAAGTNGFCERHPASNFKLDHDAVRGHLLPSAPPSLAALAVCCTDYESGDRPLAGEVVDWIEDLLKSMGDDGEDEVPAPNDPPTIVAPGQVAGGGISAAGGVGGVEAASARPRGVTAERSPSVAGEDEKDARALQSRLSSMKLVTDESKREERRAASTLTKQISERIMQSSVPDESLKKAAVAPMKMGWLYKRNRHGFRNWKKRWFVLKTAGEHSELSWFNSHEEVFSGTGWGKAHGVIPLKNCVLIKGSQGFRFQILNSDDIGITNDTRLANREVAALDETDLQEWLAALEFHIEESNKGGSTGKVAKPQRLATTLQSIADVDNEDDRNSTAISAPTPMLRRLSSSVLDGPPARPTLRKDASTMSLRWGTGNQPTRAAHSSVKEWLEALGIGQYSANFVQHLPTLTMKIIDDVGLSDADLDALQIKEDFARRLLKSAVKGSFREELEVCINGARDFGDVIVFRVESRYRTRTSVVYLRFTDFVKLQARFTTSFQNRKDMLSELQKKELPGRGIWETRTANRSKQFIEERKTGLEDWLRGLASIVKGDETFLGTLLQALELQ